MSNQTAIRLKVPRPELDQCQYFACDEKAVREWVEKLPIANIGQTSRQLYLALSEFNKVRTLPITRMAILEVLRTPIYFITRGLAKHYLNQPVVLSEQARKVAELTHTLNQQLATGYAIVATHTAALGKKAGLSKPETLIGHALHRAITDQTLNMQRRYQLYQSIHSGAWYNLHQFYALARQYKVQDRVIEDKEFGSCSVEGSYIRALLIGCSKPNQMRQEDFTSLFKPMTQWSALCAVRPSGEQTLFAMDPTADEPPFYRELYQAAIPEHWMGLDTRRLTAHLQKLVKESEPDSLKITDDDYYLSRDLVNQLIRAWGSVSKRTYMRMEEHDSLDICIGLSATHHFISGELSFEALVAERGAKTYTMIQENPFLKAKSPVVREKDVWDSAYDSNAGRANVAAQTVEYHIQNRAQEPEAVDKSKYQSHQVEIINTSAHGYCIKWPQIAESHIKPGEIVGVRETNSHNWSIATIRWVQHIDQTHTKIGLELISPTAAPYGARIIRKTGEQAEWMRVLVLPAIAVTKQPVTLLTPRVPFKSGMKAVLNQRGSEVQIRLDDRANESGAYNRFHFHRLNTPKASNSASELGTTDQFDSLWSQL